MIQFTGKHALHPTLFIECYEALIDGQRVSCQFTDEVLQDLRAISREDIAEYCKDRIEAVEHGFVLRITTEDLNRYKRQGNAGQ